MIRTAIFDMDGLLIDSEPLWFEAAVDVFQPLGITLTPELYAHSVGLRTKEFVDYWFRRYELNPENATHTIEAIHETVVEKIRLRGEAMPGVYDVLEHVRVKGLSVGLATSSPSSLIEVVVDKLNIRSYFHAFHSAEHLEFGKPHPQVYLDCAKSLRTRPVECVCFEDSFFGMIAAKAARMQCVVIPHPDVRTQPRFQAADLLLEQLADFHIDLLGI